MRYNSRKTEDAPQQTEQEEKMEGDGGRGKWEQFYGIGKKRRSWRSRKLDEIDDGHRKI